MKKTAFRRLLQRPRVNKNIAIIRRVDAAVKQAILGADRSKFIFQLLLIMHQISISELYMKQL